MEGAAAEAMQHPSMSHEIDASATPAAAAATGDDPVAEVKAGNPEPDAHGGPSNSQVDDCDTIQAGEFDGQLATQPDESVGEVPHDGGSVVRGSKSVGRQRRRKSRGAGSAKVLGSGSSPLHPMKPYEADQISEDNENRSSSKKLSKRKIPVTAVVYDDNDHSTSRRQSQRGDEELPTGIRRSVLAPLPLSELNKRMGSTPNQTPEKYAPSKSLATSTNLAPIQVSPTLTVQETSPILSLQQSESITLQVHTVGDESDTASEDVGEETIESALGKLSVEKYGPDDSSEQHDSDKENVPVHEVFLPGSGSRTVKLSRGFNTRQPLQTLYSAPSPSVYQSPDIFTTPTASPQQLYRTRNQLEGRRQWQMIVDTGCLLHAGPFESLKQLKGVHETRLFIPNLVIRDLDYLQRQEESKACSTSALEWIKGCMSEIRPWIHVQSSAEIVQVAMTSPVSPSIYSRGSHSHVGESERMQPSLHDHILQYALLLQTTSDGRVAILTDDTALKIKALAEGLVVDTATSFSDSLLNPYSERFVYSGSTPIGRSSGRVQEIVTDEINTPRSTISSSKWLAPVARAIMSRPGTPRPTSRVNFSIWRRSQPVGLQGLLA